ncbi:MAG: hypothetical protein ACPGYT_13435 [Nitrospirales bacterium]
MRQFATLKRTVFLGLLASMFVGSPAFGEISLPSAIELEKSMYFQNSAGEPVQFQPGIYEVEQNGEHALNIERVGHGGEATSIQAIPAGHDQDVEANTTHLVPAPDNNADKQHLVYVTPEGLALESVGSYSGVFSRSAMTWGQKASADEAAMEDQLTVEIEKAIYFKTIGGDPKVVQPGEYQVAMADSGLELTPADGKGEATTIEAESLGTSAAVLLPEFNENADLELLMLGTAGGQSVVALGSHSGTFPRGLWGKIKGGVKKVAKGAVKRVKGKVKGTLKKGYRFAKGKVHKYGRKAISAAKKHGRKALAKAKSHGWKYAKKYGKKIKSGAWKYGKRAINKLCGKDKKEKCIQMAAQLAQKAGQSGGS